MKSLMNGLAPDVFWMGVVSVFLGFLLHKGYIFMKRSKPSCETPYRASWWFWVKDNFISFGVHTILGYIIVVLTPATIDLISGFEHTPKQIAYIMTKAPLMGFYLALGAVIATPLSVAERSIRKGKRWLARWIKNKIK